MTTLADIRTRVRKELHDEDATAYRWTDTVLDRHIARALGELALAAPREMVASPTTTAGSRDVSLASLASRVVVEAVEYPTGRYPPSLVPFSLWGDTLTLLVDTVPAGGEALKVYYGALHTLDATTSTLPAALEETLVTGAAAYAALEWANYAVNRINVGGEEVWRQYLAWGQERLADFQGQLARTGRRAALRLRQLYRPAQPPASQSTDWGP
ncbi:MAG: hypothetical protein HY688_03350 [Chloroflexi bacterium]|nr:hypothetical protein [Chloroflexota bacterium]